MKTKINWKDKEEVKRYMKEYRMRHREKHKQNNKEYYQKNKRRLLKKNREWCEKNIEKMREWMREYRQRPEFKEQRKKYNQKPKVIENERKYRREYNQRPEVKEGLKKKSQLFSVKKQRRKNNKKWRDKMKKNPSYVLANRIRSFINRVFKTYTKTGKIMTSKQYGINYKKIIESLKPFPKDLSHYHIDHIRPLISFKFINGDGSTNLEEIKEAFAPENHQWLLASDNMSKGGRWDG